jgi:surfactin synthase thioesterase subunit
MPLWEVVGGSDKGGILVREGQDLKSKQLDDRLSTGAIVEELQLAGERLNYKVITGSGPPEGWVSLSLKGKELLVPKKEPAAELRSGSGPADTAGPVEVDETLKKRVQEKHEEMKKKDMLNLSAFKYKVFGGPLAEPKFRIFCFHNAGGAESVYTAPATDMAKWIKGTKAVEIVAFDYPGRDKLLKEPFITNTQQVAEWCLSIAYDKLDLPYVVWGHSVGTWVAFEFLMLARQIGLPMPTAAFLNAFCGPHMPVAQRPWKRSKQLDTKGLKEQLLAWDPDHFGAAGKVVFDEPAWTDTWEPMMKADFQLYDEYEFPHAGAPKFEFPIHAWHMGKARLEKPDMGQLWKDWTTGEFDFQTLDAGHLTAFYNPEYKKEYLGKILPLLKKYSGIA